MKAHFFDIESIIVSTSRVWIVDKSNPKTFIMKLDQSDFNLIKNGIYKNMDNKVNLGGVDYWFPGYLFDELKIKCKNNKSNITNLSFSMREFMDKELIDNMDYELNIDNILHLKNTNDSIYVICSENTKNNYEKIIKKIENKLEESGLLVKKYYFISETFYNRDSDEVAYKKIRLLLQHFIGIKTDGYEFIGEEIVSYDEISFYDTDVTSLKLANNINDMLNLLVDNSEDNLKSKIRSIIKENDKILFVNTITTNRVNRFIVNKVKLGYQNLIKTFESFRFKK